jgi:methylmalonyl-CoA mutase N-terminal domain/subunit
MAGVQSMHTASMDEAYALPSEEAATLALRTQQIIVYESGLADVVDPPGRLLLHRGADRPDRSRS